MTNNSRSKTVQGAKQTSEEWDTNLVLLPEKLRHYVMFESPICWVLSSIVKSMEHVDEDYMIKALKERTAYDAKQLYGWNYPV